MEKAIDEERIIAALTKADGSIVKAAKALKVHPATLRKLIKTRRDLEEEAVEAVEIGLDKAEAQILKTLREGPLSTRLQAAAYILRRSRRARR